MGRGPRGAWRRNAYFLAKAGLSKHDIKERLWQRSRIQGDRFTQRDLVRVANARQDQIGAIDGSTLIPISAHSDDINIVVAGGPGTHSVYLPTFGLTTPVTRPITDSSGAPLLRFGTPVR